MLILLALGDGGVRIRSIITHVVLFTAHLLGLVLEHDVSELLGMSLILRNTRQIGHIRSRSTRQIHEVLSIIKDGKVQ